jgi:hypothetical protein
MSDERPQTAPPLVWWIIWIAILNGLVLMRFFLGRELSPAATDSVIGCIGVAEIAVSSFLRWWVLPKIQKPAAMFVVFIVGVAIAEGCGIFGIFLGGKYQDELFVAGVLGILQWAPIFARRFRRVPMASNPFLGI